MNFNQPPDHLNTHALSNFSLNSCHTHFRCQQPIQLLFILHRLNAPVNNLYYVLRVPHVSQVAERQSLKLRQLLHKTHRSCVQSFVEFLDLSADLKRFLNSMGVEINHVRGPELLKLSSLTLVFKWVDELAPTAFFSSGTRHLDLVFGILLIQQFNVYDCLIYSSSVQCALRIVGFVNRLIRESWLLFNGLDFYSLLCQIVYKAGNVVAELSSFRTVRGRVRHLFLLPIRSASLCSALGDSPTSELRLAIDLVCNGSEYSVLHRISLVRSLRVFLVRLFCLKDKVR